MPGQPLAGPLAYPIFRRLWIGGIASNLGTMVQAVGAGWLMASIVPSSDMVALVQSATTLPVMLFSIVAGVFADSYDRRKVLMVAQLMMMTISLALALAVMCGWITPWLLLLFTFLLGCGTALHTPSWQAAVGDVVPRDRISAAVTLNSMGLNLTRCIGPALGGFVVGAAGAAAAFIVNALSFVPMIHALVRWKTEGVPATLPREDFHRAAFSGLSYVAMSPHLLAVIARSFVFGFAAIAVLALLPLVARDLIEGGAVIYGALLGAFGIGALAGGLANARVRARFNAERIAKGAFLGFAVCASLIAFSRELWLTCLLLLPAGACWVLALSLFNVVLQLSTPRWVVGRTLSIYQTASFGGMTVGSWLWGAVAESYGTPIALAVSGGVAVVGALMGMRFAMPDLVSVDLTPLNRFREPELRMSVTHRSGPIRIMIEYEVPVENAERFLETIADRRRMRIRDGVRHWVLLRDLENPMLWKETYQFPTWADYVRFNQRPTQADADVSERLQALSKDRRRPQVRRMIERHTVPSVDDMAIKINPEIM